MKHTSCLLVAIGLFLTFAPLSAQKTDWLEELQAHPEYLDATDRLCPTGPQALTPAPKGYKPFYLSHYGRHGARYAWQSDLYDSIHKLFAKATEENNLTPLGEDFAARYEKLYPDVRYRTGDLSRKGWEQQKELACRAYSNFPGIFTDKAKVRAWTSTSTRCVMTMSSFCLGLKGCNPRLDIFENFGKSFLPAILPLDGSNPFRNKEYPVTPVSFEESWEQYIQRTIDYRAILGRLFKDPDQALPAKKQWDMVSYLYFLATGMRSLDSDIEFTDLFTPEERILLWKIDNFQFYANIWPTHMGYRPIVDDIIAKADARIASGETGADLRFGHDYTLFPTLMILDVDGMGHDVKTPDDIPLWYQLHRIPMGANLQLVFYRSKKDPRILFKALLNGQEVHLPLPTDNWPYYNWEDFRARWAR